MSLEHAILGFLNYGAMSGYDLKKAFDTSVRHFWSADQSQIYRTLARLAEQDRVGVEVIEQQDKPDRKVYHITKAGRAELRRWLSTTLALKEPHQADLIQIFFAAQLNDEEILSLLRQKAEQLRATLEHFGQIPQASAAYAKHVNSPRDVFFWMLTLDYGVKNAQAELEWVQSVIEQIERKQIPSA